MVARAVKAFRQSRRKKHLLKVIGRNIASQKKRKVKALARQAKINSLSKQKPWSRKKKVMFGLGVGGAGVGYLGYRASKPKNEEYY